MDILDSDIWSSAYDISMPMHIPLANGKSLVCEEVVRAMPGRRYVCRGDYDGKPVFVKIFSFNNKATREWKSEQQGIADLKEANIAAPEIVCCDVLEDSTTRIIVFTALPNAESAQYRWEHGNETARQMLVMQLVELIARHHAAGIRQKDCHLLNFVFSNDVLYTLDANDIVKSPAPLSRSDSMSGLADIVGLLAVKYDALLPSLYEHYWQCRGVATDPVEFSALSKTVVKLRSYKLRKYLKKIYRSCSEFIARKGWYQISVCRRDADNGSLAELVKNPDSRPEGSEHLIIKDGNTCTVSLLETPERKLVCKRYNIKSPWHGLMRAFRTSRASRSWRSAHCLQQLGIKTLKPYALVEQRFGPIRRKAWLFMSYIDGVSVDELFHDASKIEQRHMAVSRFIELFEKMIQARLSHGDMKATNFIFSDAELYVIDLDSMIQHSNDANFAKAFRVDIQRFMRNWDELPDVKALFMKKLSTSTAAKFLPLSTKG